MDDIFFLDHEIWDRFCHVNHTLVVKQLSLIVLKPFLIYGKYLWAIG